MKKILLFIGLLGIVSCRPVEEGEIKQAKTEKQKNLTYLLSRLPFTSDGLTWLEITAHLSKLFPKYATISKGCKSVLKEHLYNRSTQDIKEVMTYLFNNGKFDDSDKLEYYFLYEETKGE